MAAAAAAAAARALPKYGKSPLPLFIRSRILPLSNLDLNLNTLPKDPQSLQSNQNLQTLKPLFDSSQLGKVFSQFTGQSIVVQGEQSRKIIDRDLFGGGVVEARVVDKRPVSDDSGDSDFDDDLDDIDDEDSDFDFDDDSDDGDDDEGHEFVRKRK